MSEEQIEIYDKISWRKTAYAGLRVIEGPLPSPSQSGLLESRVHGVTNCHGAKTARLAGLARRLLMCGVVWLTRWLTGLYF